MAVLRIAFQFNLCVVFAIRKRIAANCTQLLQNACRFSRVPCGTREVIVWHGLSGVFGVGDREEVRESVNLETL